MSEESALFQDLLEIVSIYSVEAWDLFTPETRRRLLHRLLRGKNPIDQYQLIFKEYWKLRDYTELQPIYNQVLDNYASYLKVLHSTYTQDAYQELMTAGTDGCIKTVNLADRLNYAVRERDRGYLDLLIREQFRGIENALRFIFEHYTESDLISFFEELCILKPEMRQNQVVREALG